MQLNKSSADYVSGWSRRKIILWLASVAGVLITLSLGQWQLNRASYKLAIQRQMDAQDLAQPLNNQSLLSHQLQAHSQTDALRGRRVQLAGHWLKDQTVFLDNRQMNARVGFYVVTPFHLAGSPDVILVQRGWAARHFQDRLELPTITTTDQQVELVGRLQGPPARLFDMGGAESGPIRQNLDLNLMKASLQLNQQNLWVDVSVQQTGAPSEGLLREWPVVASGVDKHYGYAVQWFALSTLIAGLFVWFAFFHHRLFHDQT